MNTEAPNHNLGDERFLKVLSDLLKHFITLATGSIVLLVAFIQRLATGVHWRLLIAIGLLSFALTIVSATLIYSAIARQLFKPRTAEDTREDVRAMGVAIRMTWYSFLTGIAMLVIVAIRNLFP